MRYILDDATYKHDDSRTPLPALVVVLTRFNMVLPTFREVGEIADDKAFAEWLRARITIFKSVCLQSVRSQTRLPDAWLLGFDSVAPDRISAVLDAIKPYPWIKPVWQQVVDGEHESARISFLRELKLLFSPEHKYVVSTRLDNDDALGRGYCEAVGQYAASVVQKEPDLTDFWMSFPLGAQLSRSAIRLLPQNNNAFLSRCESIVHFSGNRGGTALHGNHGHVFEKGQVFLPITRGPIWLQFVHEGNLSNKENVGLPMLDQIDLELRRYGVTMESLVRAGLFTRPSRDAASG